MKRGKEIVLNLPYPYNVVSGTVDNKNPKSLYIQISAWAKPKRDNANEYEKILRQKNKKIKQKLFKILKEDDFFIDRTIVDFDMASSGINLNKKSYMSLEVTLFKREPLFKINSDEINPIIQDISERIINDVFESDEDFEFTKTKS